MLNEHDDLERALRRIDAAILAASAANNNKPPTSSGHHATALASLYPRLWYE